MFEDVLTAARKAHTLTGIIVVTCDIKAATIARNVGAHVIMEMREYGYSAAVLRAVKEAKHIASLSSIIIIPADIPHLKPEFIDSIVLATPTPGVTIVPAYSDGGTNLLAISPCDLIPPLFGHESMARHSAAARNAGVEPKILTSKIAGHDLDRPDDVRGFLALNTRTRAHRCLSGLELARRQRFQMA
jgi:2-phospho-L-lactate guanylyltransferase